MKRGLRCTALVLLLVHAAAANACEPVVPFLQVMVPLSFSGSLIMLVIAVVAKSALFACFERRIAPLRAGASMLAGNVLTSAVGLLVAAMIGSAPGFTWPVGVPLALALCWLPARRLSRSAPLSWMKVASPFAIAFIMTCALLGSCILFIASRAAIENRNLAAYWIIKLVAIGLALMASISLTSIWEEWVVWRFNGRPAGAGFYASVLRTNLYILVLILAMPAVITFQQRMKSPDFLVKQRAELRTGLANLHPSPRNLKVNSIRAASVKTLSLSLCIPAPCGLLLPKLGGGFQSFKVKTEGRT